MKKSQQTVEDIFNGLKESLSLIGIESLVKLFDGYLSESLSMEGFLQGVEKFNNRFDLSEFLGEREESVRSEAVKLGSSYYLLSGVVSLGKDSYYHPTEYILKYRIILNPSIAVESKFLYSNIPVMGFESEEERDLEFNYMVDKLNLIGVRHITIR